MLPFPPPARAACLQKKLDESGNLHEFAQLIFQGIRPYCRKRNTRIMTSPMLNISRLKFRLAP